MAQQAQFLISIFLIFLCSCQSKEHKYIIADVNSLSEKNGIVYQQNGTLFSGIAYLLNEAKDTVFTYSYKDGKEDGIWKKFYKNGKLEEERMFKEGKKTGQLLAYYPNGKKHLIYNFKDGEYHGTCSEWSDAGVLTKEMHYNMGKEEGRQKIFYDNGKVKSNYQVIDGRQYGLIGTKNCINVSDSIFNK